MTAPYRPIPTDADLDAMQWVADPHADEAVAAIEAGGPGLLVIAKPGLVLRAAAFAVTVYLPATVLAL